MEFRGQKRGDTAYNLFATWVLRLKPSTNLHGTLKVVWDGKFEERLRAHRCRAVQRRDVRAAYGGMRVAFRHKLFVEKD